MQSNKLTQVSLALCTLLGIAACARADVALRNDTNPSAFVTVNAYSLVNGQCVQTAHDTGISGGLEENLGLGQWLQIEYQDQDLQCGGYISTASDLNGNTFGYNHNSGNNWISESSTELSHIYCTDGQDSHDKAGQCDQSLVTTPANPSALTLVNYERDRDISIKVYAMQNGQCVQTANDSNTPPYAPQYLGLNQWLQIEDQSQPGSVCGGYINGESSLLGSVIGVFSHEGGNWLNSGAPNVYCTDGQDSHDRAAQCDIYLPFNPSTPVAPQPVNPSTPVPQPIGPSTPVAPQPVTPVPQPISPSTPVAPQPVTPVPQPIGPSTPVTPQPVTPVPQPIGPSTPMPTPLNPASLPDQPLTPAALPDQKLTPAALCPMNIYGKRVCPSS